MFTNSKYLVLLLLFEVDLDKDKIGPQFAPVRVAFREYGKSPDLQPRGQIPSIFLSSFLKCSTANLRIACLRNSSLVANARICRAVE